MLCKLHKSSDSTVFEVKAARPPAASVNSIAAARRRNRLHVKAGWLGPGPVINAFKASTIKRLHTACRKRRRAGNSFRIINSVSQSDPPLIVNFIRHSSPSPLPG